MPDAVLEEKKPRSTTRRNAVADALDGITLGRAVTFRGLTMIPLVRHEQPEPHYITLRDALATGAARITEVSEAGSVGSLKVINEGAKPLFILDGEELVGAKQNRIVNVTIMVAAKTAIPIPVSCVEQGRWSYRSAEFADAPHVLYAGARAANVTRVSAACERGSRDADQHAVWAEVAAKSARMQSPSSTGAMHDVYARHTAALGEFDQAIGAETGQTGAVFAFGDFAFGFDLFDAASTLSSYLPKLVRGYALDALERSASRKAKKGSAEFLLKDAQHLLDSAAHATTRAYPAVGMGRDIRFQAPTLAGAALVVDDRAVHVTAFRSAEQTKPRTQRVY